MSPTHSSDAYWRRVDALISLSLEEDLPGPDLTTEALVDEDAAASAVIIAREGLQVSGMAVAERVFRRLDPGVSWRPEVADGDAVAAGGTMVSVSGNARAILAAERTALNFLQHLCGIATATGQVMKKVEGTGVTVLDTRKTLPGWRLLEKQAVRDGGGKNHRYSLSDGILIKDNHLAVAGGVAAAVARARRELAPGTRIEVEVESVEDLKVAVAAGADIILFDNADPARLAAAVAAGGGRVVLEASGGIGVHNVAAVASTGVDMISMGSLTHSAPAVDISLDISGPSR